LLHPFAVNLTLLGRKQHRLHQLVAVKGFALAIGLDDLKIAQLDPLKRRETGPASRAQTTPTDGLMVFGGAGILHLGVRIAAERTAQVRSAFIVELRIDGEAFTQGDHLVAHTRLNLAIALAGGCKRVQNLGHELANPAELTHTKAPRGACR
jgi:hypothetical protein